MAKIRDFLNKADYKNYRNVRAAAAMFVVLGGILALAGVALLSIDPESGQTPPPKIVAILLMIIGVAGAVGGIAVFIGNRRWSKLIYVMAALYVLAFPLGTILSVIMFIGLGRYMSDLSRFRESLSSPVAG